MILKFTKITHEYMAKRFQVHDFDAGAMENWVLGCHIGMFSLLTLSRV